MEKVDLTYQDKEFECLKIRPDAAYLFDRMNQAVLDVLDAQSGENILDVGCGRAMEAMKIAGCGAYVIGIEPSEYMVLNARDGVNSNRSNVELMRAIGEFLPVRMAIMDKVVCKGALDHFADPDESVHQMALCLKSGGMAIVAVANFDSLSCKIGKFIYWIRDLLHIKNPHQRMPWEPPEDHTIKFDYYVIYNMMSKYFKVEKAYGLSLLFCMPGWGDLLEKLPDKLVQVILKGLDRVASWIPSLSDVVILKCRKR